MCPDCPECSPGEPCKSCGNFFNGKPAKQKLNIHVPPARKQKTSTVISKGMAGLRSHFLSEILNENKNEDEDQMTAENPLALPGMEMQLPAEFQTMLEMSGFIPNIQLLQPLSDVCQNPPKDAATEPKPGHFWYGTNLSMGPSFEAIPLAAAMHALLVEDKKLKAESFSHTDAIFKEIQGLDANKKGLPQGLVPRWGADVLLYMPRTKKFGIYFLYSTARNTAKEFTSNGGKVLTIKSKIAKNNKGNSWWLPDVYILGVVPEDIQAEMPDSRPIIEKFKSRKPRDPKAEAAAASAKPGAGKDR